MNVLVVGLGSMGKRRIRLLKQLYPESVTITGVDSNEPRLLTVMDEFKIQGIDSLEKALGQEYDCAFVCTSPISHANVIMRLLQEEIYIFTELNLVNDHYEDFMEPNNQKKIFLSSTLQYRKDIQYIQKRVENKNVNYIYHSGQYLPDWHPWENYKNFFVSDKRTNACREIMAIDLPWIISAFGKIKNMYVLSGKCSELDISYNDTYQIILEHENGTKGCVLIDIVSRIATRKLEVYSEKLYLYWNGTPDSLNEYDIENKKLNLIPVYENINKDKKYCDNIIENAYMEEILTFMDIVQHQDYSKVKYDLAEDTYILGLIDKIENI